MTLLVADTRFEVLRYVRLGLGTALYPVQRVVVAPTQWPAESLADDLVEADERPAADEQDVARVDLEVLLLGVFPPPLRGDVRDRPLEQLEQGLLHPLARDVAA